MEKNNSTKKIKLVKTILIGLGCCCIAAAAALVVYNRWDAARAGAESEKLVGSLKSLLETAVHQQPDVIDDGVDIALENAQAQDDADIGFVTIDGYDICGSLYIPAIDIELAVLSEWSYPNLAVSACRYSGSPEGQLIVIAHNYDLHFGRLKNLVPGDKVRFNGVDGKTYTYEVTGTETWATNQLEEIISGDEWDLTLFTCTYGGANRVVVRCVMVEDQQ